MRLTSFIDVLTTVGCQEVALGRGLTDKDLFSGCSQQHIFYRGNCEIIWSGFLSDFFGLLRAEFAANHAWFARTSPKQAGKSARKQPK